MLFPEKPSKLNKVKKFDSKSDSENHINAFDFALRYGFKKTNLNNYNPNNQFSSSISVSTSLILSSIGYILALTTFVRSIDSFLAFVGDIFGVKNPNIASLGYLFGKVLQPFVWFLGVDWNECEMVRQIVKIQNSE